MFPETQGKTLEEIDDIFEKPETDSLREVLDGVEVTTVTKISDDPK